MACPWCAYVNHSSAKFCGDCGRTLSFEVSCGRCGVDNPGSHRFCDGCGAPLTGETAALAPGVTPSVPLAPPEHAVVAEPPAPRPPRKPRLLGLKWRVPGPRWQWSRAYLRSWAVRNRWELLAVALLTATAAFLRIYRLGDIPPGLHGDEAQTGIDALRILDQGWIGHYVGSAKGQPAGPLYFTALVVWLLDTSIFTIRLPIALLGIATVPATYLLFRLGFGRWVALVATIALVFSYWHLHLSRTAFMVVSLPLATTVAAIALLWVMRSRNRWGWLAAGALLGVIPYTYSAYPMFLAAVAAVLAAYVFLQRDQLQRALVPVGLFAAGLLVVAAPVVHFALQSPDVYFSHTKQVSLFRDPEFKDAASFADKADYVVERTWDALTLFLRNPRLDGVDGLGRTGAVDVGIAVLTYIGLAVSIARWRSPPYFFALLAVLGALSASVITTQQGGDMRRTITAMPWVFGLAGIGAVGVVGLAGRALGDMGRRAAVGGLVLVLALGGAWNLQYYFGDLVQQQHLKWVFAGELVDGLDAAHGFDDPGTIYFYSSRWTYGYESIGFLYPDSRGIDRSREHGTFDLERLDDGSVTYLLLGGYEQEIDRLKELHPGGETIVDDEPQPRFAVYHLGAVTGEAEVARQ